MEAPKQSETAAPTPEQLLKLLELQRGQERTRRGRKSGRRATFLVTGLLCIVVAAGLALFVAEQWLAEFRDRGAVPSFSGELSGEQ